MSVIQTNETIGLIAGKGSYPREWLRAARLAGSVKIAMAAFEGETDVELLREVDFAEVMHVGQLDRLIKFLKKSGAQSAVMCGQITPGRLYDMRPDFRTLLVLARLKRRNAETLFRAVADEMAKDGIRLLPANTFLEKNMISASHRIGPPLRRIFREDIAFGFDVAKKISAMDIGQSVIVKRGTVLAVEAFEGTNETIRRGGMLGRGRAVLVKVSKPGQDFRFDIPVVGPRTVEVAAYAGVNVIALEEGKTLLLEVERLNELASRLGVSIVAWAAVNQG